MRFLVVSALWLAAACTGPDAGNQSARAPMGESLHTQRMLVPQRPPVIAAQLPEDLGIAQLAAERIDESLLARGELSRWVSADALPLLTSTDAGRRFLEAAAPRALARGAPQEACPAVAVATGTAGGGARARAEVAVEALAACLAQLDPSATGCGCRVVALDDLVTVPHEETAYATGTSARLRIAALGLDLLLVAEEGIGGETLLRDLAGPVARIDRGPDNAVMLRLADGGRAFRGYSVPVGFRRGRLAERIYAEDATGMRLSLLIGFGPDELAQSAGAWLAWPPGG